MLRDRSAISYSRVLLKVGVPIETTRTLSKGALTCDLTSEEITALMNCSKQHDKQSAEQELTSGAHARSAHDRAANGHAKRIAATTSLALRLADASKSSEQVSSISAKTLLKNQ